MQTHVNKKARRTSGKNHTKRPKKRTAEEDERFEHSFERLIVENNEMESCSERLLEKLISICYNTY